MKSSGSSEPDHTPRRFRFWQLRLSTLLAIVLLSAVGMGWWSDHVRMAEELADVKLDAEMRFRQVKDLSGNSSATSYSVSRSSVSFSGADFESKWTPTSFVKAVCEHGDHYNLWGMEEELSRADDSDFDAVFKQLVSLLPSAIPPLRSEILNILGVQYQLNSQRMQLYDSDFTKVLLKLLDNSQFDFDRGQDALCSLRLIGATESSDAIEKVKGIMENDDHPLAVEATITAVRLDPTIEIGPRLKQLVEIRHPQWSTAAESLHQHLPDEEVYEFLKSEYAQAKTENDKQTLVGALNKLDL